MSKPRQLPLRAEQVDLLGTVLLSVPIGTVKREEWDKAPMEEKAGVVFQLFREFVLQLSMPDSVGVPDKIQEYRP
jgi:hypothetical protein